MGFCVVVPHSSFPTQCQTFSLMMDPSIGVPNSLAHNSALWLGLWYAQGFGNASGGYATGCGKPSRGYAQRFLRRLARFLECLLNVEQMLVGCFLECVLNVQGMTSIMCLECSL